MSDRYTRLSALPGRLYIEGAPLLIEAGALLKDQQTGQVLAQLKFLNLSDANLTACKVSIRAFDPGGTELQGLENHAYLDLSVPSGQTFGAKIPVYLPDNTTRKITVCVTEAVFQDATVWRHPVCNWSPLPEQETLRDHFPDTEQQKQYAIEVGGIEPHDYVPAWNYDLFRCTCGAIFKKGPCPQCHRTAERQLAALDEELLQQKIEVRRKKEAEEEAERQEKERIAEAERLERQRIETSKKTKSTLIAVAAIVVIGIAVGVLTQVVLPSMRYNKAVSLAESGDYVAAIRMFEVLDDYKDADEQIQELRKKNSLTSLAAGFSFTTGLRTDGTVGSSYFAAIAETEDWTDIISVAAGTSHAIGLKSDGSVVATGFNFEGLCDVEYWTDIVAIAGGDSHTVGLKSDGSVVATGHNEFGQCDVEYWSDIIQIAANSSQTIGLMSDGTVVAAGYSKFGQCDVEDWTDIVAIAAGDFHTVGLKSDGTVITTDESEDSTYDVSNWTDITAIAAGSYFTVGLKSDGTVVASGVNSDGECDVEDWTDIVAIAAGMNHTVGLKSDGTVVATGNNEYGQCDVGDWTNIKVPEK
jgi:hypothetical protein